MKKAGHLDQVHMTLCNVGSRKLGQADDYASQGWGVFAPNLAIYGFDADEDACAEANNDLEARPVSWKEYHVPLALSDRKGMSTLYVTKAPMCSSLYPPNEKLLARFAGLPELVNLDFTVEMETTTLDDFCAGEQVDCIDFLQIDVQGADLQVLKGGLDVISRSTLFVQIEVEFAELYSGQPLFADVDRFLRGQGFSLFDLQTSRRIRSGSPIQSNTHPGQVLWGEGYYVRDLLQADVDPGLKTPENLLKLACIVDVMNYPDYALELLAFLTVSYADDPRYNTSEIVVGRLSEFLSIDLEEFLKLDIVSKLQPFLSDLFMNDLSMNKQN